MGTGEWRRSSGAAELRDTRAVRAAAPDHVSCPLRPIAGAVARLAARRVMESVSAALTRALCPWRAPQLRERMQSCL